MRSACSSILLCFRYAQSDLATIRHCHERALFLCCGEPRKDVAKCNAAMPSISRMKSSGTVYGALQDIPVRANAELGTPFFSYNLGKAGHARFRCAVIDLTTARSTVSEHKSYEYRPRYMETYAFPFTPLVLLMLMIFLGSPSFTLKYGAAALTSLKGAVLCKARMVSHCLSVILCITWTNRQVAV